MPGTRWISRSFDVNVGWLVEQSNETIFNLFLRFKTTNHCHNGTQERKLSFNHTESANESAHETTHATRPYGWKSRTRLTLAANWSLAPWHHSRSGGDLLASQRARDDRESWSPRCISPTIAFSHARHFYGIFLSQPWLTPRESALWWPLRLGMCVAANHFHRAPYDPWRPWPRENEHLGNSNGRQQNARWNRQNRISFGASCVASQSSDTLWMIKAGKRAQQRDGIVKMLPTGGTGWFSSWNEETQQHNAQSPVPFGRLYN